MLETDVLAAVRLLKSMVRHIEEGNVDLEWLDYAAIFDSAEPESELAFLSTKCAITVHLNMKGLRSLLD